MLDGLVPWLDQVASTVFWWCAGALVLVDAAAVGVVLVTRSRALVDRWTGRVLAVNLLLFGAGLGVPAAAYAARLVASTLQFTFASAVEASPKSDTPAEAAVPPSTDGQR